MPYDTRFDGNVARSVRHQPRGRDACSSAASEGSAAAAALGTTLQSTGFLGCRQYPRNEWFGAMGATSARVPDAAKPEA